MRVSIKVCLSLALIVAALKTYYVESSVSLDTGSSDIYNEVKKEKILAYVGRNTEVHRAVDYSSEWEEEPNVEIEINKHEDKINEDYIGAIEIPSIGVSDSIYTSEGDYYLDRDYKGEKYSLGELYLDERTGNNLTQNGALINGHAVKNGAKFGNFKKLLDIEEQPEINVWDSENKEIIQYKMLFVSLIDGSNSGIIMKFNNEEERVKYYQRLYFTAIKQWEEPIEGDQFMLLNSCSYIIKDGRYLVVAKRVG